MNFLEQYRDIARGISRAKARLFNLLTLKEAKRLTREGERVGTYLEDVENIKEKQEPVSIHKLMERVKAEAAGLNFHGTLTRYLDELEETFVEYCDDLPPEAIKKWEHLASDLFEAGELWGKLRAIDLNEPAAQKFDLEDKKGNRAYWAKPCEIGAAEEKKSIERNNTPKEARKHALEAIAEAVKKGGYPHDVTIMNRYSKWRKNNRDKLHRKSLR